VVSSSRRVVGHFNTSDEALSFAGSKWADDLCQMGTSCPDHFLRTRISPMFVAWEPERENLDTLKQRILRRVEQYRRDYAGYYSTFADAASPAQRGSDPSVVVIPGIGLFGFAKDERSSNHVEFFVVAIQVMAERTRWKRRARTTDVLAGQASRATRWLQKLPQLCRPAAR
jgi:rhamnose utilization protein RhaD (predicted bifunctional aldolase and dehydrogenase)